MLLESPINLVFMFNLQLARGQEGGLAPLQLFFISMQTSNPEITSFLAERITAADFPSAVYLVAEKGRALFADALGNAVVEPRRIAATLHTIYDLASLTKPLITGLLCARRVEAGEITLDSSVSNYLLEFERTDKQAITIRDLLTHTSGMPAWRPLYILAEGERDRTVSVIADLIWNIHRNARGL